MHGRRRGNARAHGRALRKTWTSSFTRRMEKAQSNGWSRPSYERISRLAIGGYAMRAPDAHSKWMSSLDASAGCGRRFLLPATTRRGILFSFGLPGAVEDWIAARARLGRHRPHVRLGFGSRTGRSPSNRSRNTRQTMRKSIEALIFIGKRNGKPRRMQSVFRFHLVRNVHTRPGFALSAAERNPRCG